MLFGGSTSPVIEYAMMVAREGPRHIVAWMHKVAASLWENSQKTAKALSWGWNSKLAKAWIRSGSYWQLQNAAYVAVGVDRCLCLGRMLNSCTGVTQQGQTASSSSWQLHFPCAGSPWLCQHDPRAVGGVNC